MMRKVIFAAALIGAPLAAAQTHKAGPVHRAAPAHVAASNWTRMIMRTPEGGVRMGNPNAAVKLVEYGSRTCPTCAQFDAEGFPALLKSYIPNGSVSYEFRDYPVHGAIDLGPILLGQCVPTGAFFPVLDEMMKNQRTLIGRQNPIPSADQTRLEKASPNEVASYLADFYGYTALVTKRGLPAARAKACLGDRKAIEAIAKRADDAGKLYQISGTPSFIINGKAAGGQFTWAAIEPLLRAAGAK